VRLRCLAAAEVAKGPGGIAEHAQLPAITEKVKQRAEGTTAEDVVTALRAVAGNVAESPHGLLADIGLGAAEELNEDGNGTSFDDDLGLGSGTRSNVGEGPGGFELDESMRRA